MPWQLSGNGRSGWSTKLIRGLKAEAAAGFQSRRERCREPTPVTPQYAAFPTYKAARVHYASRWRGGAVAVWPLGAVAQQASQGYVRRRFSTPLGRVDSGRRAEMAINRFHIACFQTRTIVDSHRRERARLV